MTNGIHKKKHDNCQIFRSAVINIIKNRPAPVSDKMGSERLEKNLQTSELDSLMCERGVGGEYILVFMASVKLILLRNQHSSRTRPN